MATKTRTLSLSQAAALAGRSERFIGKLREKGYVQTVEHGKYPLVGLCRGLVAYLDEQVARQAEAARQTAATDARTREIELRIIRKSANLIGRADVEDELDDWHEAIVAEMGGLADIEFDDPLAKAVWQEEIAASLARVQELTAQAKRSLANGSGD